MYANENFPMPVILTLRQMGHDVLTSAEAGQANLSVPDEQVLRFATDHQRVLVTFNRQDFHRLHQRSSDHAGIVTCTVDADYLALARRIDSVLRSTPETRSKLIRVLKEG